MSDSKQYDEDAYVIPVEIGDGIVPALFDVDFLRHPQDPSLLSVRVRWVSRTGKGEDTGSNSRITRVGGDRVFIFDSGISIDELGMVDDGLMSDLCFDGDESGEEYSMEELVHAIVNFGATLRIVKTGIQQVVLALEMTGEVSGVNQVLSIDDSALLLAS